MEIYLHYIIVHKRKCHLCINRLLVCAQMRLGFVHIRPLRLCTNLKAPSVKGFRGIFPPVGQKTLFEKIQQRTVSSLHKASVFILFSSWKQPIGTNSRPILISVLFHFHRQGLLCRRKTNVVITTLIADSAFYFSFSGSA